MIWPDHTQSCSIITLHQTFGSTPCNFLVIAFFPLRVKGWLMLGFCWLNEIVSQHSLLFQMFIFSFVPVYTHGFMELVEPVVWDFSRTGISRENLPRPLCLCCSRGQLLWLVFWGGEMRERGGCGAFSFTLFSSVSISFSFLCCFSVCHCIIPNHLIIAFILRSERNGHGCWQSLPRALWGELLLNRLWIVA